MINKVIIALTIGTLLAAGVYELAFKPPEGVAYSAPEPKVPWEISVLGSQVLVDLAGGGYATVTVGLELPPGTDQRIAQSIAVREVVTRDLTNIAPDDLRDRERRERLKDRLAGDIRAQADVEVGRVLLTDFTIRATTR